jgi:molybdenum cofactor synthesis domain-containing protein
MSDLIEVVSVNISEKKGVQKRPVDKIIIEPEGIKGDAHAGPWHRQISMLAQESIDGFGAKNNKNFLPGEFAENITTRGIDLGQVAVLDRFYVGPVELEVTQIGKRCHGDGCAIFQEVGTCVMPKEGIFCRVLKGGTIRPGYSVIYEPRKLRFKIITLSDRAASQAYPDRSGPSVRNFLSDFFADKRWHTEIETTVLPDDQEQLEQALTNAKDEGIEVVITTGGTGVGPRDITPEVASKVCDKIIPGIMEAIRIKYGTDNPNALLSRGIAGVAGRTLIYTLPGSPKAVEEYMSEILKTLEHLLLMLHRVDAH